MEDNKLVKKADWPRLARKNPLLKITPLGRKVYLRGERDRLLVSRIKKAGSAGIHLRDVMVDITDTERFRRLLIRGILETIKTKIPISRITENSSTSANRSACGSA